MTISTVSTFVAYDFIVNKNETKKEKSHFEIQRELAREEENKQTQTLMPDNISYSGYEGVA